MKHLVLASLLALAACLEHADPARNAPATEWRYDTSAHHYEHVSTDLQKARAANPSTLAARICADMAGTLEFISSNDANRASFTCRFEEDGHAFSMDFGALVRN